jgi:hypothetical protein
MSFQTRNMGILLLKQLSERDWRVRQRFPTTCRPGLLVGPVPELESAS